MLKEWTTGIGSDAQRLRRLLRKLDYEVLGIFNASGQPLAQPVTSGHEGEVPIPRAWAPYLAGSTLIHNHPNGTGPSRRDLEVFTRYELARMEIVTRDGLFTIDVGGALWTTLQLEQVLEVWRSVNVLTQIESRNGRLAFRDRGPWESTRFAESLRQLGFVVDYSSWTSSTS